MLQLLLAVVVAVWYYHSARRRARPPIKWAAIGVAAFVAPSIPWAVFYLVVLKRPLIAFAMEHDQWVPVVLALGVSLIGLLLGALGATWVHRRYLGRA